MILNLYYTSDGVSVVNKTLTNQHQIEINVSNDFDIVSPALLLRSETGVNLRDFNYCEIPDLNRKYFIRDIVAVNRLIFSLACECDVLETYRDLVLNSNCQFKRKIKVGDYDNVAMLETLNTETENFISNKTMGEGSSLVLTTVGVE